MPSLLEAEGQRILASSCKATSLIERFIVKARVSTVSWGGVRQICST